MRTSKSKTFQKDDPFHEVYEWLMNGFEVKDNPADIGSPEDKGPILKTKYIITITKIED